MAQVRRWVIPLKRMPWGRCLAANESSDQPLLVGSVKTNIGHLEGASGIAGLIKLILSIHHRQIPPSLNFETPNPHIDFAASNLRVVTKLEPWPEPRKAGSRRRKRVRVGRHQLPCGR